MAVDVFELNSKAKIIEIFFFSKQSCELKALQRQTSEVQIQKESHGYVASHLSSLAFSLLLPQL